jgi:hypothetical protein
MENFYVVLIKLVSGESIVGETLAECEDFLKEQYVEVLNPVILNTIRMPRKNQIVESHVLTPWLPFSKNIEHKISSNKIVTMIEVTDNFKSSYLDFLEARREEEEEEDEESQLFEEANNQYEIEEFLENVVEKLGDYIEEDEEQAGRDDSIFIRGIRRGTRTIH